MNYIKKIDLKTIDSVGQKNTGTKVTFLADPQYFDNAKISVTQLTAALKAKAVLSPGLKISFFDENPLKINTLTNKQIADEIGVHPSTVSRILRNKYIETPKGVMPLKSLLISSVSKTRRISPLQLMKLIEDVIKAEKKPKSDKRIAIELNKRGFGLARRTITKYRKKNNIPSSRHR